MSIYRYGDEASLTTHRALYATGHTTLAALQLYDLGPRAIFGRAARKAGIHFVKTLHEAHSADDLKKEEANRSSKKSTSSQSEKQD